MKKNKLTIGLFCMFVLLLGLTIYTGLGVMADEPEIVVKKTSLVYDQTSGVEVEEGNIIFNDKNQTVDYKILVENTQDYDIKISDIKLSTPTEEFLSFEAETLSDNIVKSNSTKEIVLSLETTGIKGWGRNFNDNLTANISFDKVEKEPVITPPVEEDKKEEQEKPPIEEEKEDPKEEVSEEDPSKEEVKKDENLTEEEIENEVENPYTSDKDLVIVLGIMTTITGALVLVVSKNKISRYAVLVLVAGTTLTTANAEKIINIPLNINVSFKSQNVMEAAYITENDSQIFIDYWIHADKIKNIYIENEITKISDYKYKYDITEEQNGRVKAYLVSNENNNAYYDLYIQADGIIYINEDASYYFANMTNLDLIDNIEGLDTGYVTNMSNMFHETGYNSTTFELDVTNFNTSNVTDMSLIFKKTGYSNPNFTLDVSSLDTSKVTDMESMFEKTGFESTVIELDLSNFNTSKVTDMNQMFEDLGRNNPNFTLDVSSFDTSKVTNMAQMFEETGYNSTKFTLNLSNFNTSNVTDMKYMFYRTGYNAPIFTLDVSNFDTSKVQTMRYMFYEMGYASTKIQLDVSKFDTSNTKDLAGLFAFVGYNNPDFTLDTSNIDTSKAEDIREMFRYTGYKSNKFKTSIFINNPSIELYSSMFNSAATLDGSKIKINYIKETERIVDIIVETYLNKSNITKGNLIVNVDDLSIGDELHISGEKFNVISIDEDTITAFAKYNIGTKNRQSVTANHVKFSDISGWESTPGPKEIDIQIWGGESKILLNNYINYLNAELETTKISGNLISLKELASLGCEVPSDYLIGNGGWSCKNSSYKSWLVTNQSCWTRSARAETIKNIWIMHNADSIFVRTSEGEDGIRPTITIPKNILKNMNK